MRTKKEKKNIWMTLLLAVGLVTILFPLYMTIVIAFKNPSDMTTNIAGLLSLPKEWSFHNFIEAIETTNFFQVGS